MPNRERVLLMRSTVEERVIDYKFLGDMGLLYLMKEELYIST